VNGLMSIFLGRFDLTLRTALKNALEREEDLKSEIAVREQIQAEHEKLITQLELNNAELERFTYTVSHDLKSPLVTIKGFLGMLKKDMEQNQMNRVQNDMQRISDAAEKMGALLSDLLELSRIGRQVNPPEEIDLVKLTRDTLETLDGRIREHNVSVTVSPDLPIVYADRNRLREVLENLIDNAAKYMGEQTTPLIEIGQRDSGTETIIYIKDNGIGVEPQFHTKIFGLFEKLNAASEGSGIGLALIKRIIEVHGGRIWVESEGRGKGSIFCFTIPDRRGEYTKEITIKTLD
jgi:signal transduction histidine kinase